MSIKTALKALFGKDEPATAAAPSVELTVSDISKDLVSTIAKLDARTKALGAKISQAEAAAAAANEAKRLAFAEQTDAFELSKRIHAIVVPQAAAGAKLGAPAPTIEVAVASAGAQGDRARTNGAL